MIIIGEDEAKYEKVSKFSPPPWAFSGTSAKFKRESKRYALGIRRNEAGLKNRIDKSVCKGHMCKIGSIQ